MTVDTEANTVNSRNILSRYTAGMFVSLNSFLCTSPVLRNLQYNSAIFYYRETINLSIAVHTIYGRPPLML